MNKKILSETFVIEDFLPKDSHVKNSDLNSFILNDLATQSFQPINKNRYGDINLSHRKQLNWIFDYIRDQIFLRNNKMQIIFKGLFATVDGYLESSFSRNNIDTNDILNSPHLTILYCVNGEGELVIEYPDNKDLDKYIILDTEPGKIIIFNSSLNYYFLKNNFKDLRTTLCYTARIV